MKYMLLIHQGDTPTPNDPEAWSRLSESEQQAVYAAYGAINANPGVPARRADAGGLLGKLGLVEEAAVGAEVSTGRVS